MPTNTLDDIRSSIKEVGDEISSLATAFNVMPPVLDTAYLPAQYIYRTGRARHVEDGDEIIYTTRDYELHYAVDAYAANAPTEQEVLIETILDDVLETWYNRTDLPSLTHLVRYEIPTDSGAIRLPEYGGGFVGFTITVTITTIRQRENVV
jgi:hypothetical protein